MPRLFQAVMDDGVQYLSPVEDRWGEIAVYPELMIEYAERLRALIRRVWLEEPPGGHVIGTAICLSCLLEAGRYGDLIELLGESGMPRSRTPMAAAAGKVMMTAGSIASARTR